MNTELTPSEARKVIEYVINQNIKLAEENQLPIALNLEGSPGLAKTSVVKQIAEDSNTHHFIRLNVSELESGD